MQLPGNNAMHAELRWFVFHTLQRRSPQPGDRERYVGEVLFAVMHRRVYLVEPTEQLVALLSFDPDHPLREVAAIVAPKLDFESHYEGWRMAWESKAKSVFVEGVVSDWCDCPPVCLLVADLQARSHAEAFDSWWTIREIHHLSIDESWRPS